VPFAVLRAGLDSSGLVEGGHGVKMGKKRYVRIERSTVDNAVPVAETLLGFLR
jgi:hypothetical protein